MTSQDDFTGINLEKATLNWNLNYIYNFLSLFSELEQIDWIIDWMTTSWDEIHHVYDSYDNINNSSLREESRKFAEQLRYVKSAVIERKKQEEKKKSLRERMLNGNIGCKSMTQNQKEPVATETTQTAPPLFQTQPPQAADCNTPEFRVKITDLPYNLQKKILVSQTVFDLFVKQLNEDTWTIINGNKKQYSDPLRFVCNYHGITSRDTSRDEFDELLHQVVLDLKGKGSLSSSMGRYKPTSDKKIKRSYLCYANADVNSKMKDEIWPLYDDCQPLEQSLEPVFKAMEQEKNNTESRSVSFDVQVSANM